MKTNREFFVSSLMLMSLCALGLCQFEDKDSADEVPEVPDELLPDYTSDKSNQTPALSDMAASALLDKIEGIPSPSNSTKFEPTSEPYAAGTTSPEPSKKPELYFVDYMYRDDYEDVCVRARLQAVFQVDYLQFGDEEGEEQLATTRIKLPVAEKADIGGSCGAKDKPKSQLLKLQWEGEKYELKIHFEKARSGDTDDWVVDALDFTYDTGDIIYFDNAVNPGAKTVSIKPDSELFESPFKKSYTCKADDRIEMTSSGPDKAFLIIYEMQIQPFLKREANGTFSEAEICEGDKIVKPTSNVASVAVGATLGCLILIVIIVYAVGRRMGSITDRTGYKAVE